jgi:hypothetical protein
LVRSSFFPTLLAESELGDAGTAWFEDTGALDIAVSSLGEAKDAYLKAIAQAPSDVEAFQQKMANLALEVDYLQMTRTQGNQPSPQKTLRNRLIFARSLVAVGGVRQLVATGFESIARRLR